MSTRRHFLKLFLATPIAAQLGAFALQVKTRAAAAASSIDGYYTAMWVWVIEGTGRGQSRQIVSYNGATKIATLSEPWAVQPDSTSEFKLDVDAPHSGIRFR
jgi:hypothetical protein